jgi:arylsulfatase
VFVVHADHGEEFGEHGRYGHQPHLTENLVHVPLVVANAGRQGVVERPVSLQAVPSTITALADAPSPFPSDPLWTDAGDPWAVSKVFADGNRRLSFRTRDYKYIQDGERRKLYDLRLDPDEQVNLHGHQDALGDAFEKLSRQHVSAEQEHRAVSAATADVRGEL